MFSLVLNNLQHRIHAPAEMPLLWALRDLLRLTGTKYGCGMGVCGACTVHEDGTAVRSCQIPLSATTGKRYTTIEGLSVDGSHPCQRAWLEQDVSQCGYCRQGLRWGFGRRESELSYDPLKEAGVDLATSEPYDAAMRRMNTLSDQLQSLLQHLRQ